MKIEWKIKSPTDTYDVLFAAEDDEYSTVAYAIASAEYTLTGLSCGTNYSAFIRRYQIDGQSEDFEVVKFSLSSEYCKIVTVSTSGRFANMSWKILNPSETYEIILSDGKTSSSVANSLTSTSYSLTNLDCDTNYFVTLRRHFNSMVINSDPIPFTLDSTCSISFDSLKIQSAAGVGCLSIWSADGTQYSVSVISHGNGFSGSADVYLNGSKISTMAISAASKHYNYKYPNAYYSTYINWCTDANSGWLPTNYNVTKSSTPPTCNLTSEHWWQATFSPAISIGAIQFYGSKGEYGGCTNTPIQLSFDGKYLWQKVTNGAYYHEISR